MFLRRVIPVLLLEDGGLVKTINFKKRTYIGDPINAVKIFNEKEVDEMIFLDISANRNTKGPNIDYITDIASECFMPLCYGGGIRNLNDIERILKAGVEKVSINTLAIKKPDFIKEASKKFGSSTIVVSIDVKKNIFGKEQIYNASERKNYKINPVDFAKKMEHLGAGEIMINSVDHDGTFKGYNISLIKEISEAVSIPVIACGGAQNIQDFAHAIKAKASAVAAGSMFVFQGKHRAVLINYPSEKELQAIGLY